LIPSSNLFSWNRCFGGRGRLFLHVFCIVDRGRAIKKETTEILENSCYREGACIFIYFSLSCACFTLRYSATFLCLLSDAIQQVEVYAKVL
jgi:hypothetical protein